MPIKILAPNDLKKDEDWAGNNAAFTCPKCKKVFIVSWLLHKSQTGQRGYRQCPDCGKSVGRVGGGRNSGGMATLEW